MKKIIFTFLAMLFGYDSQASFFVCEARNHRLEMNFSNDVGSHLTGVELYIDDEMVESFGPKKGEFDSDYGVGPNGEVAFMFRYDGKRLKRIWTGSLAPIFIYDVDGSEFRSFWDGAANTNCKLSSVEEACYERCLKKGKPEYICGFCYGSAGG